MKQSDYSMDQSSNFNNGKMESQTLVYQSDSHHNKMVERNRIVASKNILKVDMYVFDHISRQTIGVSSVWNNP